MSDRPEGVDTAAVRRLADAATEGPWERPVANVFRVVHPLDADPRSQPRVPWVSVGECERADDAAFIAAARTLVPVLCDEVDRLRAEQGG